MERVKEELVLFSQGFAQGDLSAWLEAAPYESEEKEEDTCAAMAGKQKDKRCKRKPKAGFEYCSIHLALSSSDSEGKGSDSLPSVEKVLCAGTCKNGSPCKKVAQKGRQYCYTHREGQAPAREELRCGELLKNGQLCRASVPEAGKKCFRHKEKDAEANDNSDEQPEPEVEVKKTQKIGAFYKCGGPLKDGGLCRVAVSIEGNKCYRHKTVEPAVEIVEDDVDAKTIEPAEIVEDDDDAKTIEPADIAADIDEDEKTFEPAEPAEETTDTVEPVEPAEETVEEESVLFDIVKNEDPQETWAEDMILDPEDTEGDVELLNNYLVMNTKTASEDSSTEEEYEIKQWQVEPQDGSDGHGLYQLAALQRPSGGYRYYIMKKGDSLFALRAIQDGLRELKKHLKIEEQPREIVIKRGSILKEMDYE
jgi:hypothetical protein